MTHHARNTGVVLATALLTLGSPIAPAAGKGMKAGGMGAAAFMKAANGNGDRTLSKDEVEAYAKKRFAKIESDNDKTLSSKELQGRISAAGFAAADADKDKTVDEAEFVGYADKLFDEANAKGDKSLSMRELRTPAGRKLIALLR